MSKQKRKEAIIELKIGDHKAWAQAFKEAGVKANPSGSAADKKQMIKKIKSKK